MDTRQEKLARLKSLQELQNTQALEGRVRSLEEAVANAETAIKELAHTLSTLQMEFNRDHIKLGAQDASYKNR
jgi:hypothetical protein